MAKEKLKLGNIDDVELFCRVYINKYVRAHDSMYLSPEDFEDLLQEAMVIVWELFSRYDHDKGTFSGYAGRYLPNRITDVFRKKWGRDGQKFSIEQAYPFSALGVINSIQSNDDKTDSSAYLGGLLLR